MGLETVFHRSLCGLLLAILGGIFYDLITRKWGRWQHHVDYRPFAGNRPILRPDAKMEAPLQFELITKDWNEA